MNYFVEYIRQTMRFVIKAMSFVPAIVMLILIFMFSEQDGEKSGALSYEVGVRVITYTNETLDKGWTAPQISNMTENGQVYIRKAAHFVEYFLLAVSVAFPLYVYGLRGPQLVLIAGAFCVGLSVLDECHQFFSAGRTPRKFDVAVDTVGILCGIIFTRIVGWTGRKTIFRPLSNNDKKSRG